MKYLLLILFVFPIVSHAQVCGSNMDLQWNNSSTCGATTSLQWDNSKTRLKIENEGLFPAFMANTSGTGFQVEGIRTQGGAINIFGVARPGVAGVYGLYSAEPVSPLTSGQSYIGVLNTPAIYTNLDVDTVGGVFSAPFTRSVPSPSFTGTAGRIYGFATQSLWLSGGLKESIGYWVMSPLSLKGVNSYYGVKVDDLPNNSTTTSIKTGTGRVVFGDDVILQEEYVPSSDSSCEKGRISWGSNDDGKSHWYVCVETNHWMRTPLETY